MKLSNDCQFMACMECGVADCGCKCHGISGLDPLPKEPMVKLLKILLLRHFPCNHGSPLANCKIRDWMVENQGLLRGLRESKCTCAETKLRGGETATCAWCRRQGNNR